MNREAKKEILRALSHGHISRMEAKKLILSDGRMVLNLSKSGGEEISEEINKIIKRIPAIKYYFQRIISLGNGIKL